ncbi:hypothetical protein GCM10011507_15330 [Edaphobacter acidisoli]|uniref:Uncharacterized protein n=1 Tax=Edaphobacter acidisoli TaxID=2040573 RepID=A0A916RSN4_9BACT|nr:hypothetical protein GCM10011507_15330 [Edaphobacter acidisoli]
MGEGAEAGEEALDPAAALGGSEHVGGQGEREEGGEWSRSHGGEVAEAAGECAVADGFGRVGALKEVAGFEGEVGGDGYFVAGGWAEERAVVADAERDVGAAGWEAVANLVDQRELA